MLMAVVMIVVEMLLVMLGVAMMMVVGGNDGELRLLVVTMVNCDHSGNIGVNRFII